MYSIYQWCFGIGVAGPFLMLLLSGIFGILGGGGDASADISLPLSHDVLPDASPDFSLEPHSTLDFQGVQDFNAAHDLNVALDSGANVGGLHVPHDISHDLSHDAVSAGTHGGAAVLSVLLLFLPLSPLSILCMSLLFGTVGLLSYTMPIHLLLSIIAGLTGCFLCNFTMRKLKQAKNRNVQSKDFVWQVGTLTMEIGKQGYGEVQFSSIAGATTFTARHNGPLPQGSFVVSIEYRDGEMWVEPLSEDMQTFISKK